MSGMPIIRKKAVLDEDNGVSPSVTRYLAIFTTNPTDLLPNSGTEASYSGYARVACAMSAAATSGSDAQASNSARIDFAVVSGGTVTVSGIGLYTALTSGTLLRWASASKAVVNGDNPFVAAGGFVTNQT